MLEGTSNLVTLAEQTDGISLIASNDLRTGMAKIAADLSSHYVLGYYTNNTRWDGGSRAKLTVKLKSTGKAIRARREFRAPTEEEMSSIRNARSATPAAAPSADQMALSALARVSPSSRLNAYGTVIGSDVAVVAEIAAAEIEGGRFKQGASVEILLTPKDGQPVTLTGKIDPLMRGTLVRTPAGDSKGPWQAVVRMRGDDNLADSDTVSIERSSGTLLGKPIAYRAASAAASAYRPLAAFQFRRTERVRIEWPALQARRIAPGPAARSHRQADRHSADDGDARQRRRADGRDRSQSRAAQQRRLSDRGHGEGGDKSRHAGRGDPGVYGEVGRNR